MLKTKIKNTDPLLPDHKSGFAASILKKQFRIYDWIAERVIKAVAFLSITIVVLIFIFVFRETLPLFRNLGKTDLVVPVNSNGGSELQPESYSPEGEGLTAVENSPSGAVSDSALRPETYGIEPSRVPDTAEETAVTPMWQVPSVQQNENRKAIGTFLSRDWQPVSDHPRYGLLPLFFGTLKVTLIAILFAGPVAIMAAIYTALFAPKRIREYIKPCIELLAGFPSVVIGFFALMVLASFLQDLFGYSGRLNGFVGGIAMALAAIPVIYTLTEDALSAVPRTYLEAGLGLGASIRQTAFGIILPAATPGIFAAVLLGIGRIFGETMIALMATGNASLISLNPFDSVRTLSATIGAEMAEVVFGDTHYSVLFMIGSLLFIFTFILNALAEFYFRNRLIRRFQGK